MMWTNGRIAKQLEIEQREAALEQRTRELDARENRMTMQEAEIGRRERQLQLRESSVDAKVEEKVQSSLKREFQLRETELDTRQAELEKRLNELAIQNNEVVELDRRTAERARAIADREAKVEARLAEQREESRREFDRRESALRAVEGRLRSQERDGFARVETLAKKEAELADRERTILEKEMATDVGIATQSRESLEALAREHSVLFTKIGELHQELAESRRIRFEELESELVKEAWQRRQALDLELQEVTYYAHAIRDRNREAIEEQAAEHQRLLSAVRALQAELAQTRLGRFAELDRELTEEASRRRDELEREVEDARRRASAALDDEKRASAEAERLRSEATTRFAALDAELAEFRRSSIESARAEAIAESDRMRRVAEEELRDTLERTETERERLRLDLNAVHHEYSALVTRIRELNAELAESRRTGFDGLERELAEARRTRLEQFEREFVKETGERSQAFDHDLEEARRVADALRDRYRGAIDEQAVEHQRLLSAVQALQTELTGNRVERFATLDRELIEESRTRREALADELRQGREQAEAELEARRSRVFAECSEKANEIDRTREEMARERARLKEKEDVLVSREDAVRVQRIQLSTDLVMLEEDRQQLRSRLEQRVEEAISDIRLDCEMKERRIEDLRDALEQKERRVSAFEDLERRFAHRSPEEIEQRQRDLEQVLEHLREELAQRPVPEVKLQLKQALDEQSSWRSQLDEANQKLSKLRAEESKWRISVSQLEEQTNLCEVNERIKNALLGQIEVLGSEVKQLRKMSERPEDAQARIEAIQMHYLDRTECIEDSPSEVDWLIYIHDMCNESGMIFPKRLLEAFHTSLKTAEWSPLTVLAGVSGTGKSELPRLYSWFGGLNFLGLPVQPNWDSPQSLFGFFNPVDNRFNATPLLQSLEQSQRDPDWNQGLNDQLLIILLDEMNLAHVELYFSDLLSKLESRRGRPDEQLEIDIGAGLRKHRLTLTRNVLWVGTMNEDETTKTLSDKVLDRSNLIGFPRPKKLRGRKSADLDIESKRLHWETWCTWNRPRSSFKDEQINPFKELLQDINVRLEQAGRALGHRVWQSIEHYMANHPAVLAAEKPLDNEAFSRAMVLAFEDQLVQKVMPKLRGIETSGRHRTECLDPIRTLLDSFTGLRLIDDFNQACTSDYGGFVWKTARYLEADE